MMGQRVHPGQPISISATDHNRWQDAADRVLGDQGTAARTVFAHRPEATVVVIQNDSGAAVDAYAVLGIDGPLFETDSDEFARRVTLSCVTPVEGEHEGRFVITREPIADGEVGRAVIAGVTQVQLQVDDDTAPNTHADIINDDVTALIAGTVGAEILWREGGTGTQWAIVRLGGHRSCIEVGKLIADLTNSQTAVVNPTDLAGEDNGLADVTLYAAMARLTFQGNLPADTMVEFIRFAQNDGTADGLIIGIRQGTRTNPKILGGSGVDADTEEWDIADQPAGCDGVSYKPFRLHWSGVTGEPVYQFIRTATCDSAGLLCHVSAEVRSVAFNTGSCQE